jgi:hypothetical protein
VVITEPDQKYDALLGALRLNWSPLVPSCRVPNGVETPEEEKHDVQGPVVKLVAILHERGACLEAQARTDGTEFRMLVLWVRAGRCMLEIEMGSTEG